MIQNRQNVEVVQIRTNGRGGTNLEKNCCFPSNADNSRNRASLRMLKRFRWSRLLERENPGIVCWILHGILSNLTVREVFGSDQFSGCNLFCRILAFWDGSRKHYVILNTFSLSRAIQDLQWGEGSSGAAAHERPAVGPHGPIGSRL